MMGLALNVTITSQSAKCGVEGYELKGQKGVPRNAKHLPNYGLLLINVL